MFNRFLITALMFLTAAMNGCARLDYVKVPTPTQYSLWTRDDQRNADRMKGVRYYLPRPFVHLKQSVPVAQRVAFVSLEISKDKTYYEISLPKMAPLWLKRAMPRRISSRQVLQASLRGRVADANGAPLRLESGADDGPNLVEEPEEDVAAPIDRPSELTARTGFISDTDPVTRLSDRMDVVYLPDFEEQYVIQPYPGLGQADIETRLRNGWAAEVFAQKVDNSNLIPYVIRQVESASEAAAGIFTTWAPLAMGVPPGTVPTPSDVASGLRLESGEEITGEQIEALLGGVILFKVAEVKIAQPGIYPILKPREIQHWLGQGTIMIGRDPQETLELSLQTANLPWVRPDMAFIPVPPFTMVGFNVTTDIFIAPATQRMAVQSSAAPAVNRVDYARIAAEVGAHINAKILVDDSGVFRADVRTSGDDEEGIIVKIVVPDERPASFTNKERDDLNELLEGDSVVNKHLDHIELPLTREELDVKEGAIDRELNQNEAAGNKWTVSLELESQMRNTFTLTKSGSPTIEEEAAKALVLSQWEDLSDPGLTGERSLEHSN